MFGVMVQVLQVRYKFTSSGRAWLTARPFPYRPVHIVLVDGDTLLATLSQCLRIYAWLLLDEYEMFMCREGNNIDLAERQGGKVTECCRKRYNADLCSLGRKIVKENEMVGTCSTRREDE